MGERAGFVQVQVSYGFRKSLLGRWALYQPELALSNASVSLVTSSCLCKNAEGSVSPLAIELAKNRVNDALHARGVYKADHGSRPPAHFHEAALDDIGGAQLPPEMAGEAVEGQQLG